MANRYCSKCQKTFSDVNFYTYKNGEKCELCKSCLTMHINNWEPDTFLWLLEKFDVPYIEPEWNILRDRAYQKDPYKMTGMSVFGKYLSKMKLKQWKEYSWADTERLKEEAAAKAAQCGKVEDDAFQAEMDAIKEAYEKGEITEAEYKTYSEPVQTQPSVYETPYATQPPMPHQPSNPVYPTNNHPFEEVELEDVGASLTAEDKVYLAVKWGRLYKADEWVTLEATYKKYEASFDIHNSDLEYGLIQLCKLDLKLNQALDCGDYDSYAKLYRSYDALRKSLKFTEAQNKDGAVEEFDCTGVIVAFCERETGGIPEYEIKEDRDIIDTIIRDNQTYIRELIYGNTNIAQQIEQYLKKKEILESQDRDLQEAQELGLENVEITDEDLIENYDRIEREKQEDAEFIGGLSE